jgi:hypothetical protein
VEPSFWTQAVARSAFPGRRLGSGVIVTPQTFAARCRRKMHVPGGTFCAAARWLRDDMRNGRNADEAPPMRHSCLISLSAG